VDAAEKPQRVPAPRGARPGFKQTVGQAPPLAVLGVFLYLGALWWSKGTLTPSDWSAEGQLAVAGMLPEESG
jgi:hypothetical protein